MADDTILYLEKVEIEKLFDSLSDDLKDRWRDKIEEETLDTYETDEELDARKKETTYENNPEVLEFGRSVMEKVDKGESIDGLSADGIPDAAIPMFFYNIGACGMAALIQICLQRSDLDDEIMESIAGLSKFRHYILEYNASAKEPVA